MMHGRCGTLESGIGPETQLKLCNSFQNLTCFVCVTLTYRISQRQENPACPDTKPLAGYSQFLCDKSGGAISVIEECPHFKENGNSDYQLLVISETLMMLRLTAFLF